jgi:hypothetical protein
MTSLSHDRLALLNRSQTNRKLLMYRSQFQNASMHTTIVFLLLATAFTDVVAGNGPKGVGSQSTTSLSSLRRLDKDLDKVKGPSKRDCKFSQDEEEIEFECKTKEEDEETEIKDKIKFKVKIAQGEGLTVKVKYEQEIETQETETETETQYDVKFDRVIEYRKNIAVSARASDTGSSDVDMAYEWDSDTIVQEWPLDNWQNFSAIAEEGSLSTFSIASHNNTAKFIFTVARDDSGNNISANKMKIDFELTDFPWTADDTYVALLCTVESERQVEVEGIDDSDDSGNDSGSSSTTSRKTKDVKISFADAVDTIGFTPFGVFDWADTAEVRVGNSTNLTAAEITTIQVVALLPPATRPRHCLLVCRQCGAQGSRHFLGSFGRRRL